MTRPDASHKPVLTALVAILILWPGLASAAWIEGERARLQALAKITARISTLDVPIDTPVTFGTLGVSVRRGACHQTGGRAEEVVFLEVVGGGGGGGGGGARAIGHGDARSLAGRADGGGSRRRGEGRQCPRGD